MAADAGIFGQYLQPVKSVSAYRADMDREESNALQLAAGRMQAQQAQQDFADGQTLRTATMEAAGDQNALVKALNAKGLYKQAQAIEANIQGSKKTAAEIAAAEARAGASNAQTEAAKYEIEQKKRAAAATRVATFKTPEEALADLQAQIQSGEVTPEQGEQFARVIPRDAAQFGQWQLGRLRSLLTPQQLIEQVTAKPTEISTGQQKYFVDNNPNSPTFGQQIGAAPVQMQASPEAVLTDERTRSEGEKNRGVQRRGQDMTNARSIDANTIKQAEKKATDDLTKGGQIASFETMLGTLDRLTVHPGLKNSVGLRGALPTIPGSESANFQAELNSFQSQAFIPMVAQLKGMGALSDAEGKKLTQAVGALDPKMGEKAFRDSVGRIKADMEAAYQRVAGRPRNTEESVAKPPPAPKNGKGWALHTDAKGNKAYVSPDGKSFEEVR